MKLNDFPRKEFARMNHMSGESITKVGFGILLLKDGKVLLGKRHENPEKASSALHGEGTWTMPGGKLHFRETFEVGATREVLEETGIQLKSITPIAISNDIREDTQFITIGLFSDEFEGEPNVLEPNEITEWNWFPLNQLPSPMYPPSKNLLENYLEKKMYTPQ